MITSVILEQPVARLQTGTLAPANTTTYFERRRVTVGPGELERWVSQEMMLAYQITIPRVQQKARVNPHIIKNPGLIGAPATAFLAVSLAQGSRVRGMT
jgi:hypothetical protein